MKYVVCFVQPMWDNRDAFRDYSVQPVLDLLDFDDRERANAACYAKMTKMFSEGRTSEDGYFEVMQRLDNGMLAPAGWDDIPF